MAKSKKNAAGTGSIRKKTVTKSGKTYTFWEARYSAGFDPGTGKQIQRSISGKTQKEVAQKLKAVTASIDSGTYTAPNRMTVGQWLDVWSAEYLGSIKPRTVESYLCQINNHIKPNLGAIKLETLDTLAVQRFYNGLSKEKNGKPGLSPKSIKIVHGVLHKALGQAVAIGYLRFNPADACQLPRVERKEIAPLDNEAIASFMKAIRGHCYETVYLTMLFTGMRRGEICGLTWDCVNLDNGTIFINKQLQKIPGKAGEFRLVSTKNSKGRTITVAASVVKLLREHKVHQIEARLKAGPLWKDTGFVFTNDIGEHLSPNTLYHNYKRVVAAIGLPDARLHDLRHPNVKPKTQIFYFFSPSKF